MEQPQIIRNNKIRLSDEVEITVCVLDDGRRIIPEPDMLKALKFLGLNETEIIQIPKKEQS